MYHSTSRDANIRVNVTPSLLEAHLQMLKDKGLVGCSVQDLIRGVAHCRVGITFDDGYLNNLDILSLLERYGAGATFFVLTDCEGETLIHHSPNQVPIMGEDDWRQIDKAGFEVAAHGLTHRDLASLPIEQQEMEIVGSINTLKQVLGRRSIGYAYPYGSMCRSAYNIARNHASYACATRYHYPLGEDRWRIRRINVSSADHPRRLALKMGLPFRLLCDLGY